MKNSVLRFNKISLSWKLAILYSFIFSLVLIFLNASILYGVKFFLIDEAVSEVDRTSSVVAEKITAPDEHTNIHDPELVNETQPNSETFIKIVSPDGKVINISKKLTEKVPVNEPLNITKQVEKADKHLLVRNIAIRSGNTIIAYIQVLRDLREEYDFIRLLFALMAIADLAGIILSVLAGYITSRRMLNPIDKITRTAQSISISDLNRRIEVEKSDDEIGRLALTFNEMIERLQISFEKQNQFVSDASHELKTPISIIQGYINLMDRWGKEDKDILQESINAIKKETAGMKELIERLLFLASGDNDFIILQKEKIILSDLLEEVTSESRLIAPNHRFSYQVNDIIEITADRKMLKQMLRALLDNSIKFTPFHGEISISALVKEDNVQLIVRDTGIGIPWEERENIFARFYRVDKARGKESGGSGLGLSIVKWIVDVHGGQITAESTPGQGTSIIILLPYE